mmetsp:Transcript_22307/g.26836  ORF Transcript_22307/g.26836 Transcript_22307/m.26836 type:complete len:226 (+) Transcript_22307:108-785(+)
MSPPLHAVPDPAPGGVLGTLTSAVKSVVSGQRPWGEMVDIRQLSTPSGVGDAFSRVTKNVRYFFNNYLIFLSIVLISVIFFRPASLFTLLFLGASWTYLFVLHKRDIVIGERVIGLRMQYMLMTAFSAAVIFFFTNVGAMVGSSIGLGVALIVAHAGLLTPAVDPEADEAGPLDKVSGFLSNTVKSHAQKLSLDNLPFKLPDHPLSRKLERASDAFVTKLESGFM